MGFLTSWHIKPCGCQSLQTVFFRAEFCFSKLKPDWWKSKAWLESPPLGLSFSFLQLLPNSLLPLFFSFFFFSNHSTRWPASLLLLSFISSLRTLLVLGGDPCTFRCCTPGLGSLGSLITCFVAVFLFVISNLVLVLRVAKVCSVAVLPSRVFILPLLLFGWYMPQVGLFHQWNRLKNQRCRYH